jgi:Surface-adhesin protein E
MTGAEKYTMKKILLTITLILFSTNTMAEWTKVFENDDKDGYTIYADLTSIRKAGDRVKMWTMIDYKTEQKVSGVVFLSKTIRRDYDCMGEHTRILAFKLFSWNMEQGKRMRSYNQPQKWEELQPESKDEIGWNIACGD